MNNKLYNAPAIHNLPHCLFAFDSQEPGLRGVQDSDAFDEWNDLSGNNRHAYNNMYGNVNEHLLQYRTDTMYNYITDNDNRSGLEITNSNFTINSSDVFAFSFILIRTDDDDCNIIQAIRNDVDYLGSEFIDDSGQIYWKLRMELYADNTFQLIIYDDNDIRYRLGSLDAIYNTYTHHLIVFYETYFEYYLNFELNHSANYNVFTPINTKGAITFNKNMWLGHINAETVTNASDNDKINEIKSAKMFRKSSSFTQEELRKIMNFDMLKYQYIIGKTPSEL